MYKFINSRICGFAVGRNFQQNPQTLLPSIESGIMPSMTDLGTGHEGIHLNGRKLYV